ncbi:PRC-barrel domain-containing protein [Dietzia sp. ANT_WB102]|uniref:PRC-barrel domain-containing protein n=1 Tax=Dietzia sp. ANT_WB102 TaxID=2597345 RepID=UPI0011EDB46D|nr:PRC-barrel domain-containing protein [Dietzia sp. ANT_WB102]KAA0917972.1 hypothetical protein FQ137_00755 [Dietzia sp. ANT_WB102]
MNLKEQLDALLDSTAFDSTGAKVGAVRQIYVDDASGKATFATVATGIFSADAIVPLHGARLLDNELHVDHTRAVIRDSPRPENTDDALTPEQEVKLQEYYGIETPTRLRGAASRESATEAGKAAASDGKAKMGKAMEGKPGTTDKPKGAEMPGTPDKAPSSGGKTQTARETTSDAAQSDAKTPSGANTSSGATTPSGAETASTGAEQSGSKTSSGSTKPRPKTPPTTAGAPAKGAAPQRGHESTTTNSTNSPSPADVPAPAKAASPDPATPDRKPSGDTAGKSTGLGRG